MALAIPLAKVKKIVKADADAKMIKPDALTLIARSSELFVEQFVEDSYHFTKLEKRKTVKLKDMQCAINQMEIYDFLTTDENILSKDAIEPDAKRTKTDDVNDFWLPLASIRRVAKGKLNLISDGKISIEQTAAVGLARAATIFVSMVTACALEATGKRSTLQKEDVYAALEEAEFQFAEALDAFVSELHAAQEQAKISPKKKKLSGFFKFSMAKREEVKMQNPDIGVSGCAKILGQMWRDLNDEERASYTTKETEEEEDPQGGELDEVVDEITEEVAGGVKGMDGVDGPDRPDTDEMVAGADNMAEDGPPVE